MSGTRPRRPRKLRPRVAGEFYVLVERAQLVALLDWVALLLALVKDGQERAATQSRGSASKRV